MVSEEIKLKIENIEDAELFLYLTEMALDGRFYGEIEWGEKLLEIVLDKIEDVDSVIGIGINLAINRRENLLGYAYDAFSKAVDRANNASDLKMIANHIALSLVLHDEKWAREVYQMAIDKAECMEDYLEIADCIAMADFIYDIPWAGEVLRRAIVRTQFTDKIALIIHWIFEENGTNREVWALQAFEESVGMTIDEVSEKHQLTVARK